MDAAAFKAKFPEFTSADDALVTSALGDAALLCPTSVWGALIDEGVGLRTAQALALSPFARSMNLASDGKTVYDDRLDKLILIVAGGGMVI